MLNPRKSGHAKKKKIKIPLPVHVKPAQEWACEKEENKNAAARSC